MEETEQVVWTVGVNFLEVGSFDNEAEALGCFNEYCELEPSETVTIYKDGVMDDQRDPLPSEDESEDESEGEDEE